MSKVHHLIYVSRAVRGLREQDVEDILAVSRERNRALEITGLLLYADDSFIQVLEGGEGPVEEVFRSIERDRRHRGVKLLLREPIAARHFPDWCMGFERIPRGIAAELRDVFVVGASSLRARLEAAEDDVKNLIASFVEMTSRTTRFTS